MALSRLQLEFLRAAHALSQCQRALEALVTAELGRTPYAFWIQGDGRNDPALSELDHSRDGQWEFHFHGLELDVVHARSRMCVRIDFAPDGGPGFTPYGVELFVETSCAPWPTFPELKQLLSDSANSAHRSFHQLWHALGPAGLIRDTRVGDLSLDELHGDTLRLTDAGELLLSQNPDRS